MYKKLFTPYKIGNCEIPNRLVVPAMVTNYCTYEGEVTDRFIKYLEEKAKGGWGLIITEDYHVQEHAKGYPFIPGAYKDSLIEGNKKLTETIHNYDSKIFCQLYHCGRQTMKLVNGGVDPVAPSAIECPAMQELPRELTIDEIHEIVDAFGQAARRSKEAGFDGVEVHAGHGYLIAEFLSPFVNKRVDEYGGCFENRTRILTEIYHSIRKEVGDDYPVIVRFSGIEYVVGGRTEAEAYELAVLCEELGFDALHVSNGSYASSADRQIIASMFTEHALNADMAEAIKKLVNVPVIVTNRINDPKMADILLTMGKADFIGMGRASLADPYLPKKALNKKCENIRYCLGCLQGCMNILVGKPLTCLVNPSVGREYENVPAAETKKKVSVIGAGPAGLKAAETAALRGHDVTIYEASNDIGGQFKSAAYPIGKGEHSTFASSMRKELKDLNVPIHLNTEVNEEMLKELNSDAIVLATGAKPLMPNIKGIDSNKVVTAEDVLLGRVSTKVGSIVVCGGGEVGCETAHFIAQTFRNVTVVEMQPTILNDMAGATKASLLGMMNASGVKCRTSCKVEEICDEGVVITNEAGVREVLPADLVVSAFGYKAYNPLEEIAKKYAKGVYVVGGAIKAGNAVTATADGYNAGLKI